MKKNLNSKDSNQINTENDLKEFIFDIHFDHSLKIENFPIDHYTD